MSQTNTVDSISKITNYIKYCQGFTLVSREHKTLLHIIVISLCVCTRVCVSVCVRGMSGREF